MEACIDADEKGEALKYIPKLADPRERAEVFNKHVEYKMQLFINITCMFLQFQFHSRKIKQELLSILQKENEW